MTNKNLKPTADANLPPETVSLIKSLEFKVRKMEVELTATRAAAAASSAESERLREQLRHARNEGKVEAYENMLKHAGGNQSNLPQMRMFCGPRGPWG